jgi:sarcosine oxidase subunit alpha
MTQPFRLAGGGVINRSRRLAFEFDGTRHEGHPGDTLASALLANGVHFVARSFKYHRPRGIFSAGSEEPNALVQLARFDRTEPNVRATTAELFDGLVASSQNRWPSLAFDVGAINGALSRLLPAGFYYKTFMWPSSPQAWLRYEHVIRAAAGLGRAATAPDPDRYEHHYAHCDVLIVGAGPAGLAAARASASTGARVIVCDEGSRFGGSLIGDEATVDGDDAMSWIAGTVRELAANPDVTLLARTTAFGWYDDNLLGLVERVTDHLATAPPHAPRQRLWKVRARSIVLASGAHERPVAYANNDLPGTMLAGAALTYVRRYAVRPGQRVPDGAGAARRGRRDRRHRRRPAGGAPYPLVAPACARARPPDHRRVRYRGRARRQARRCRRHRTARRWPDAVARLRSRLRVRRLESCGPSVFAGAGHAALRRRLGGTAAAIVAAADCAGRCCERHLRSCRCTR